MSASSGIKNAAKTALIEPLEALVSQTNPRAFLDEAKNELLPGLGNPFLASKPKDLAGQELSRARNEEKLKKEKEKSDQDSQEQVQQVSESLRIYQEDQTRVSRENKELQDQLVELQEEVVGLAKASGVDTKIHLTRTPKIGKIDISFLTFVIKTLRVKVETSKSASDMVTSRQEAKSTGMLAWVSGKQMKIHEQGTLQLQG